MVIARALPDSPVPPNMLMLYVLYNPLDIFVNQNVVAHLKVLVKAIAIVVVIIIVIVIVTIVMVVVVLILIVVAAVVIVVAIVFVVFLLAGIICATCPLTHPPTRPTPANPPHTRQPAPHPPTRPTPANHKRQFSSFQNPKTPKRTFAKPNQREQDQERTANVHF
jgi:chromate transport protein ChrA